MPPIWHQPSSSVCSSSFPFLLFAFRTFFFSYFLCWLRMKNKIQDRTRTYHSTLILKNKSQRQANSLIISSPPLLCKRRSFFFLISDLEKNEGHVQVDSAMALYWPLVKKESTWLAGWPSWSLLSMSQSLSLSFNFLFTPKWLVVTRKGKRKGTHMN